MTTFIGIAVILVVALTLAAALAPEIVAMARGRHFAGVHRYLHDDAGDSMRPGDRAWVREVC